MELCSTLCGSPDKKLIYGRMDTCVCMAGPLHCSSETIITLLIGYTPIQNKKSKIYICCLQNSQFNSKDIHRLKVMKQKFLLHVHENEKKTSVAIFSVKLQETKLIEICYISIHLELTVTKRNGESNLIYNHIKKNKALLIPTKEVKDLYSENSKTLRC